MEERFYRNWVRCKDLVETMVVIKETDLFIMAERNLSIEALSSIQKFRRHLEEYIAIDPGFQTSLTPFKIKGKAPSIIKEMARASSFAGVGPFACVAGAIAEYVGKSLLKYSKQIIVENGGDIFIRSLKDRMVGIYAGKSTFNGKIGLKIKAKDTPMGICTSSGTVGHSLSFGKADAVVAISKSALLADAAATRIGNLIKKKSDIPKGIKFANIINGLRGVVIIKDDKMGAWGKINICQI